MFNVIDAIAGLISLIVNMFAGVSNVLGVFSIKKSYKEASGREKTRLKITLIILSIILIFVVCVTIYAFVYS